MTTPEKARPRYGNFSYPRSAGFFGLTFWPSIMLIVSVIVALVTFLIGGPLPGLIVMVVCAAAIAPLALSWQGRTGYMWAVRKIQAAQMRRRGEHLYRSGPFSRLPGYTYRLPGGMASSQLYEGEDAWQYRFGMIRLPQTGECTVVLSCSPSGDELLSPDQIDHFVAAWGSWLANLGQHDDIGAATVTIETLPDTGQRLRSEQLRLISPGAPPLAAQIMRESAEMGRGTWQLAARLALTFKATTGERRRSPEAQMLEIAGRLPEFYQTLEACGVAANPMTGAQICGFVRRSYEPSAQEMIEDALTSGDTATLRWDSVGPSMLKAGSTLLEHDGAYSHVTAMEVAPEATLTEDILRRLLSAHPEIPRKRVAIVYRPMTIGKSSREVESDYRDALNALRTSNRTKSADALLRERKLAKVRDDEAMGHILVPFSMLITATTEDPDHVPRMRSVLDSLTASARIQTRPCYDYQSAAFAAGLGIGFILPNHVTIPTALGG